MALKLVLWDVDGTLVPTTELYVESIRKVAHSFGKNIDRDTVFRNFVPDEARILLNLGLPMIAYPQWLRTYEALHTQFCHRHYFGIESLLSNLKRKGVLSVLATDKSKETLEITLREVGLWYSFPIWSIKHTAINKATTIRDHLTYYRVEPKDAVLIGDLPRDIDAARETGVGSIIMTRSDSVIDWQSSAYDTVREFVTFCKTTGELKKCLYKKIKQTR